jgi:DNA-directed RNA polymerase subunit E'/Rpb7
MFFKVLLYQNIFIPARFFGENINEKILSNVITITEGKKISPFGTVVIIIAFFPIISLGKILPGSSSALFRVSYDAVTFRVMKGEVVNVVLTHTTKFGFFGEAGLLEVFVSKELMPLDFHYNDKENCFKNQRSDENFKKGDMVKIRIVGVRNIRGVGSQLTTGTVQAIGTMKGLVM